MMSPNLPRNYPTPVEVRAARTDAGLTQLQAAELIYAPMRTFQDWESGISRMHPGLFELFQLKIALLKAEQSAVG